ncbi:MAG: chaperonin GroEL (HSP60 family) [Candidatus Midichloriaceae bacterium]|jgi:chaperonin GroEL (HSP60 family)
MKLTKLGSNKMSVFHNTGRCELEFDPSLNIYEKEINNYKSLWKAVITQALMDASSNSKKRFAKKEKIEAIKWLVDKDNKDFKRICLLAGLEYEDVSKKVIKALTNGCKWRNDKKSNESIEIESLF